MKWLSLLKSQPAWSVDASAGSIFEYRQRTLTVIAIRHANFHGKSLTVVRIVLPICMYV